MVVTHRNIDKLVDRFIENGNCYYTVTTSSGIHNKNEDISEIEEAAEKLKKFFAETEGSEATYVVNTFKVVPKGGLKKNSEADVTLTFKAQKYSPEEKEQYRTNRSYFEEKMLDRLEQLETTLLQQQAIINSPDDEEVEENMQGSGILGTVQAIMEIPQVQQIANALVGALTNKFFNSTNTQPMTLAGTETKKETQTVTLEQILETLFAKGVTMEHLYKLSQFDQAKIKMLLSML